MSKGSMRRRGKSSWELKVEAPPDPTTGRRRIKYRSFKGSKRDAATALTNFAAEVSNGKYGDAGRMTVREYVESWLRDHAAVTVAPKTFERYDELLRLHVVPYIGELRLSHLAPVHVQQLRATLLRDGRRPRAHRKTGTISRAIEPAGLSPQTVKSVFIVLGSALRQAIKLQLIAVNPAAAIDKPKVERKEIRVFSDDEVRALFESARGRWMSLAILLAFTTGLRRGELLALRWSDLDLDGGLLSVRQSLEETRSGLRFKSPKTNRSHRTITLPASTIAALRNHEKQQKAERLKLGVRGTHDALVFSRRDPMTLEPQPIRPRNLTKEFDRLRKSAGIAGGTFHGLRHTHLTNLLRANVHPKVASERAGHSSVSITLDVYSHAVPSLQADAARLVEQSVAAILEG